MFRYPLRLGSRPGTALKAKTTAQSAGRLRYPRHLQTTATSPARNAFYSNPSFYYGLAIGATAFGWGLHQAWSPSAAPAEIQYANGVTMLQVCSQFSDCHSGGQDTNLLWLKVTKAAKEIEAILGSGAVSFDEDVIEAHGHSDWSTSNSSGRPVAIVYPNNTKDVSDIAKVCFKHSVPMDLNKRIQSSGLFLPMDPSPTATIGGMVSTNCSGTNAFRYGTMKDWVINVTVVLPDGRIIKTRQRPRKSSAGYNLTSLFVGAEGTLGMITEITCKLAVLPQETGVAVVSFPSISDAATAASKLIRSVIQLAALELMDDVQMGVLNKHGSAAVRRWQFPENPTLFLKFSGTKEGVHGDIASVKSVIEPFSPSKILFAANKQEEIDLWSGRKEALWTMTSIKPQGFNIWSTDVAVPISKLAELIDISKQESDKLGVFASIVGHVGDGNFHQAVMYDAKNEEHVQAVEDCVHKMMDRAVELGGTVSGEHGIGIGKKECLLNELGVDTIDLMRALKSSVDPKRIMNPGKVFDVPKPVKTVISK
ncbi:d-lactate dehydrogenase [Colletotrichum chrysophilum]|uniref:D-lactate dehydrogenase (cytochrome) n=1 Tax=Colletotrichum chrysophilum TaxID=1836956 RepID=A0AAD9AXJ0_9PEZI|nr:d-lactate dehydrogenase [Colletotrichum chrysophilum]